MCIPVGKSPALRDIFCSIFCCGLIMPRDELDHAACNLCISLSKDSKLCENHNIQLY